MNFAYSFRAAAAVVTLSLAGCNACSNRGTSGALEPVQKEGPVVARIGTDVITAAELKQKLAEQSAFMQARFQEPAKKREFLDTLVRFELLHQEARRRGLDLQPRVQARMKEFLVEEIIRQEFDEKQAAYPEQALKAFYDQHLSEFVQPERVRTAQLFLAAAEGDKAARTRAKARATELLAQLQENEARADASHPEHTQYRPELFSELARKESQDPSIQAAGGILRWMSRDEMGAQYSLDLVAVVFGLDPQSPPRLLEEGRGFRIVKLLGRQASMNRAFTDPAVRETVQRSLFREERTKAFEAYTEKLKADAKVAIDEKVLEGVSVPGGAGTP
jgi:peptidyl-prolyl cis-trans isomerase C